MNLFSRINDVTLAHQSHRSSYWCVWPLPLPFSIPWYKSFYFFQMAEPPIPLEECVKKLAIVIYTIPRINRSEKFKEEVLISPKISMPKPFLTFSPTKVRSKIALVVKDYQMKVSINVPVTDAAPQSGAASTLAGLLGVAPPRIDRKIAWGHELLPLNLCCLVSRRSDIL